MSKTCKKLSKKGRQKEGKEQKRERRREQGRSLSSKVENMRISHVLQINAQRVDLTRWSTDTDDSYRRYSTTWRNVMVDKDID